MMQIFFCCFKERILFQIILFQVPLFQRKIIGEQTEYAGFFTK